MYGVKTKNVTAFNYAIVSLISFSDRNLIRWEIQVPGSPSPGFGRLCFSVVVENIFFSHTIHLNHIFPSFHSSQLHPALLSLPFISLILKFFLIGCFYYISVIGSLKFSVHMCTGVRMCPHSHTRQIHIIIIITHTRKQALSSLRMLLTPCECLSLLIIYAYLVV